MRASTSVETAKYLRQNTNKKDVKPYLVHPKEWIVAALLLAACVLARACVMLPSFAGKNDIPFYSAYSSQQAQDIMGQEYCATDIEILCGGWNAYRRLPKCGDIYGVSLPRLWRLAHQSRNCSLATTVQEIEHYRLNSTHGGNHVLAELDKEISSFLSDLPAMTLYDKITEDDSKLIVKVMIYSIIFMWQDALELLPERSAPHLVSPRAEAFGGRKDERQRMVNFHVRNIIPAFGMHFELLKEVRMKGQLLIPSSVLMNYMRLALEGLRQASSGCASSGSSVGEFSDLGRRYRELGSGGDGWGVKAFCTEHLSMVDTALDEMDKIVTSTPSWHYKAGKVPFKPTGNSVVDWCLCTKADSTDGRSLITNLCQRAYEVMPAKLNELYLEEGSFFKITRICAFAANLCSLLIFLNLFSAKRRLVARMDKGKRRLEQELGDPVLRRVLEQRAQSQTNPQEFITRLEQRLVEWDSNAAAARLMRRYVRNFRGLVVLTVMVSTGACVIQRLAWNAPWSRYLETTSLSLLLFVLSCTLPTEASDTDIDGGTSRELRLPAAGTSFASLDPSDVTEALLPASNKADCAGSVGGGGSVGP